MIVELDGVPVFVGNGSGRWDGDRPVLLLVHGAGMDRTVWVLIARWFARHGFDVVAPDLPGHGRSGGAPPGSVTEQADWLWRLIERLRDPEAATGPAGEAEEASGRAALSAAPIFCAGHSMGALACVAMAGARPDAVARLLLLGAGYPMTVGPALLDAAAANARAAIDMITVFGHAHASRLGRNTVAGISVVNSAAALLANAAAGVLHADLAACHAYDGAEAAAERFGPGRTDIIAGGEDRMTPRRGSRRLAELFAGGIDTLDDCGHMMMAEQPQATLEAMRAAIARRAADAPEP